MGEFLSIVINCVGIVAIALCTYVVIPAVKEWRATKLDEKQRAQLTFWVETGVLWAQQWLQSKTGQEKKAEVMKFVVKKAQELGLPFTQDDIDKAIEAIYNTVKDVTNAATGAESVIPQNTQ